ncbi:hypothetical protein EMGBS10_14420 [Opitutia bacterium]|nr:hypothetical protein EMGBS10_14420 [Opitutae bacterium]
MAACCSCSPAGRDRPLPGRVGHDHPGRRKPRLLGGVPRVRAGADRENREGTDQVTAIPDDLLAKDARFEAAAGLTLRVDAYHRNATLRAQSQLTDGQAIDVTKGIGATSKLAFKPQPESFDDNNPNRAARAGDGPRPGPGRAGPLGRLGRPRGILRIPGVRARGTRLRGRPAPGTRLPPLRGPPQHLHPREVPWHQHAEALRERRHRRGRRRHPAQLRHLDEPAAAPRRRDAFPVQLRQSRDGKDITVLQVVRNPGAWIPYASVLIMSVGLLWQFGFSLIRFVAGRGKTTATRGPPARRDRARAGRGNGVLG